MVRWFGVSSAVAEELHYRAWKAAMNPRRLNYLNVGEVLRRRGYRCKACDGEVPLVSFWNTGDAVCTERLCLARLSGSWAGCTYCRAMVCPQCILGSDMLASAKEFELAMTAAPAVGAEVVPHFWRHAAQAALADQAEPAPPAVAGTTTTWAALRGKEFELAMTAAPDAFLLFRAEKVSCHGYDCYWDDQQELWAYDSDGWGKLKWWLQWRQDR